MVSSIVINQEDAQEIGINTQSRGVISWLSHSVGAAVWKPVLRDSRRRRKALATPVLK